MSGRMITLLQQTVARTEFRFLVAGAWNTLFGYLAFLVVYAIAGEEVHIGIVLSISYAISLVQAYLVQRLLVFRSTGAVRREFGRFALASLVIFLANLAALPVALHLTDISAPILQGGFVIVSTIASYLAHKHYSFAR